MIMNDHAKRTIVHRIGGINNNKGMIRDTMLVDLREITPLGVSGDVCEQSVRVD